MCHAANKNNSSTFAKVGYIIGSLFNRVATKRTPGRWAPFSALAIKLLIGLVGGSRAEFRNVVIRASKRLRHILNRRDRVRGQNDFWLCVFHEDHLLSIWVYSQLKRRFSRRGGLGLQHTQPFVLTDSRLSGDM